MTPRLSRDLFPWEARCGCPKCKVGPGQRCVTTRPLHMPPWTERELRYVGTPTAAHKVRYQLWCAVWGRRICTVGAVPTEVVYTEAAIW
jgi:hypothetical protein